MTGGGGSFPGFDPFDAHYLADPHPVLRRARREAPVFHDESLGVWVVTRYDTVRDVFRDTVRYSATAASEPLLPWCDEARAVIEEGGVEIPPLLVNNDPPDHQVHRRFLGAPFARSRIAALEPMVRRVVARHLEPLRSCDRFDIVREVAWEVPVQVLFEFLGIPSHDVATLKQWTASRVRLIWGHPDAAEQVELARNLVDYARYSRRFVAAKAADPGDDYTSDLLRAVDGEGRDPDVVRHEIAVNVFNLLFAGHETTTNMMANAVHLVLGRADVWAGLVADPSTAEAVAEEALRMEPSVVAWRRRTRVDVVLDGVDVPGGSVVLLMLSSANRDASHFPDPDAFVAGRDNVRDHLTFGFGIHYCLGAQLARMQLTALLEQLATGFPTLALAEDQQLTYVPNTSFRGPERLVVERR